MLQWPTNIFWRAVNSHPFHMGIQCIRWHVYVTEQVLKSVNQIKQVNNLQRIIWRNVKPSYYLENRFFLMTSWIICQKLFLFSWQIFWSWHEAQTAVETLSHFSSRSVYWFQIYEFFKLSDKYLIFAVH